MATVLPLSSHLPALRPAFSRAGPLLKKLPSCEMTCRRQRGTFHVHRCLFLLLSAPLPTSTCTALSHPSRPPLHLSPTIPSICVHERHMRTSPPVRGATQRDGIPRSYLEAALCPVGLAPDAPQLSRIPGSEPTWSHRIWF